MNNAFSSLLLVKDFGKKDWHKGKEKLLGYIKAKILFVYLETEIISKFWVKLYLLRVIL